MKRRMKSLLSVLFLAAVLVNVIPVYAGATEATAAPTAAATDAATTDATATDATATVAPTEGPYVAPESWTAFMMYSAEKGDWSLYEATEGVNTVKFVGDGVYEITLKGSDIGATAQAETPQVFLIDIPDFCAAMDALGKNYQNYTDSGKGAPHDPAQHFQPTDLTIDVNVFVDGEEVRCKSDKLNYGNIEEKGTFRIEIYNIWGLHAAAVTQDPPVLADAISPESEIKVVFSIQGTGYNTDAGAAQIAAANPTPTTAPVADTTDSSTDTTTETAADAGAVDEADNSSNTGLIIGIIAAVVVVAAVAIVLVAKKKKK